MAACAVTSSWETSFFQPFAEVIKVLPGINRCIRIPLQSRDKAVSDSLLLGGIRSSSENPAPSTSMFTGLELLTNDFNEKTSYRFSRFEINKLGMKDVDIIKKYAIEIISIICAELFLSSNLNRKP